MLPTDDSISQTTQSSMRQNTPSSPLSPETVNIVVIVVVITFSVIGFLSALCVCASSPASIVSEADTSSSAFVSAARPTKPLRLSSNLALETYAAYPRFANWNPFPGHEPQVPWYIRRRAPWGADIFNESDTDLRNGNRDSSGVIRRTWIGRPLNQLDLRPSVDHLGSRLGPGDYRL